MKTRKPGALEVSEIGAGAMSISANYGPPTDIKHGIATSGKRQDAQPSLDALELPSDVVVVDRTAVERAKPEPDLFLACQEKLGVAPGECYVVGDAVWDVLAARRAGMLAVGLLSGGYGEQELAQAGAYRVYADPSDLLSQIYQLGLRTS